MSERHHRSLHAPLSSVAMVGLSRYREATGDVISRLVVARYRGILEGAPLWHVMIQFAVPEGPMRLRSAWTRRDRRQAALIAENLLQHHGEGEIMAEVEGLSTEVALHRLRRVTRAEMAHLPPGYLEKPSIELREEDEDGADLTVPTRTDAGPNLSVPTTGVGAYAVRAPRGPAGDPAR